MQRLLGNRYAHHYARLVDGFENRALLGDLLCLVELVSWDTAA